MEDIYKLITPGQWDLLREEARAQSKWLREIHESSLLWGQNIPAPEGFQWLNSKVKQRKL